MPEISIFTDHHHYITEAEPGENLLSVLQKQGISFSAVCGGNGTCGKCTVEKTLRGEKKTVLACRETVSEDCEIFVRLEEGGYIEGQQMTSQVSPEKWTQSLAAVDLGTTTIAVQLFSPEDPEHPVIQTAWNAQRSCGADVISRIQYIMEHLEGMETLRSLIEGQIMEMIEKSGAPVPQKISIAGNTVMEHILAGISPVSIASAPFIPETYFMEEKELFLSGIPVFYAPCAAGYVGGDIIAGLSDTGICEKDGTYLYLDIGTNGEMALVSQGKILCCAVASGPAFEGAGISCGMAGTKGAVSHVRLENDSLSIEVIGEGEASGICGSGLVDLIAVLLEQNVIDGYGRLLPPEESDSILSACVTEDELGNGVFHLTDRVFLTAEDVRQIQLAKAAVAAGIDVLISRSGCRMEQIEEVLIAGGFGTQMDPHNAAAIGMLPRELEARTEGIGNASFRGIAACAAGRKGKDPEALRQLQQRCTYIELSGSEEFNDAYIEHMIFSEEEEEW